MSEHDQILATGSVDLIGPNGERISVRGSGASIEIDIERTSFRFRVLSQLPSRRTRTRWLQAGQSALRLAGLAIVVLVDGRPIAYYSGESRGSLLARVLGLGPVDLKTFSILTVAATRLLQVRSA
jgi:hypothetical protein